MKGGINTIVEANTLEELQSKCIGYNHDHCKTLYFGKRSNLPLHLGKLFKIQKKYCAIFEESFPVIPKNYLK